jgi:hypothetical protein
MRTPLVALMTAIAATAWLTVASAVEKWRTPSGGIYIGPTPPEGSVPFDAKGFGRNW